MGKDFWKTVRTIIIIVAVGALLWFGLKWFGEMANDNAGTMDGGAGTYEDMVDNQ